MKETFWLSVVIDELPPLPQAKLVEMREADIRTMEERKHMWRWLYRQSVTSAHAFNQPARLLRDFAGLLKPDDPGRVWLERFIYYYTPHRRSLKEFKQDPVVYAAWGIHTAANGVVRRKYKELLLKRDAHIIPPCQDINDAIHQGLSMLSDCGMTQIDGVLFGIVTRSLIISPDMFGYPSNAIFLDDVLFDAVKAQRLYEWFYYDDDLCGYTLLQLDLKR